MKTIFPLLITLLLGPLAALHAADAPTPPAKPNIILIMADDLGYHMGKQQAVRLGSWKGVRFGGTKEPIELYDLDADIGETRNVAADHPDVVKKIAAVMEEARANSEFNRFWPLPEHRQNQIKMDKAIFDQLEPMRSPSEK